MPQPREFFGLITERELRAALGRIEARIDVVNRQLLDVINGISKLKADMTKRNLDARVTAIEKKLPPTS